MAQKTSSDNQWKGPWQDRSRVLDLSDVADWFSQDPHACVTDDRGQRKIRSHEQPSRPWYGLDRLFEMAERQHELWWDDLKREVSRIGVPADLAPLFADYLAGFALVKEFDSPKVDQNHSGRVLPDWRKKKRFLKKSGFGPDPSLRRPGSESLRSVINRFMEEKLATHPSPWKREFCGHTLCELWRLVEEEIVKAGGGRNADLEDRTSARISRRSRQRSKPTTKG